MFSSPCFSLDMKKLGVHKTVLGTVVGLFSQTFFNESWHLDLKLSEKFLVGRCVPKKMKASDWLIGHDILENLVPFHLLLHS